MTEGLSHRGDDLYATAQAQQAANRASLLRSQEEQKIINTAGRLVTAMNASMDAALRRISELTRPNRATGDGPRRRPEPPTPSLTKKTSVNRVWFARKDTLEKVQITLFSGDTTSSLEVFFDILPKFTNTHDITWWQAWTYHDVVSLTLPVGKDSAILVFGYVCVTSAYHLLDDLYGTTIFNKYAYCDGVDSVITRRAFFVGRDMVKEITLPESISSVFFYPDLYLPTVGVLYELDAGPIWARARYHIKDDLQYYWFGIARFNDISDGWPGAFNTAEPYITFAPLVGPGIYSLLNHYETALALFDWSALGDTWFMDTIYGFIDSASLPARTLAMSGLDRNGDESITYFGTYPPTGTSPDFPPTGSSQNAVWRKAGRNRQIAIKPTDPYETVPDLTTLKVAYFWDWGDANYCKEQLLALGFSSTDIEP